MPSDICNPSNHDKLQQEALQVAVEQNIINKVESASKIYVGHRGEFVNFVLCDLP